jgi:hypothetical protein
MLNEIICGTASATILPEEFGAPACVWGKRDTLARVNASRSSIGGEQTKIVFNLCGLPLLELAAAAARCAVRPKKHEPPRGLHSHEHGGALHEIILLHNFSTRQTHDFRSALALGTCLMEHMRNVRRALGCEKPPRV